MWPACVIRRGAIHTHPADSGPAMNSLRDRIALHTWTLDKTPLPEVLGIARDAGFNAIELRFGDFKRCAEAGINNNQVLDMIRASGLKVSVMGTEYGVIFAQGDESERLLESLDHTCANAAALGCDTIMVAPGLNPPTTIEEAAANFRKCGEVAQKHGIRFALEFNSRHALINSLAAGRKILAMADHPNCGLLLDAYHLHCSGAVGRGFEEMPAEQIFTFQYSDAPLNPVQVRTATDRLPPGKGVIPWVEVFQLLMEKNYAGYIAYEAPNPAQWSRPPAEVAREAVVATRQFIAEAEARLGRFPA
jgi:2-keto-myo-inositol isomerase